MLPLQCEESVAKKYLATVLRMIEEEVCAGNKVIFQRCIAIKLWLRWQQAPCMSGSACVMQMKCCHRCCSFGNFQPKHKPARKARNPRTQEVLEVPPQTVPMFSAAKMFKDKVNQLTPSKVEVEEEEQ